MKKIVLRVDLHDDKAKQKAMKTVATLSGIDSIAMEMKERKMTVIGAVDPINIVTKLRKNWPTTDIILVGPAKEPEKPPEKKEEGGKPEEGKKEEAKKEGDGEKKKEEGGKKEGGDEAKKEGGEEIKEEKKKEDGEKKPAIAAPVPIYYDPMLEMIKAQRAYNPYMYGHQPYHQHYGGHQPYGHQPYNYHPSATTHHYVQNVEENPSGTCTIV